MCTSRRIRALRAQDGLTLAEVTMAALVLILGALAVLSLVSASARNSFRAEQSQTVANRLQDELEKFRQLADNANYDRIALGQAPTASSDPNDPDYRVSGSTYAVNRNRTGFQAMVISGGGFAPVSHFSSGDVQGTIHRYVVWEPSSACPAPAAGCLKRVIVSIALDPTGSAGIRRYQETQTLIGDPTAQQQQGDPCVGSACDVTPWTFWLTDTPCNNADRQPIPDTDGDGQPDNHATHNTRGACSAGVKDSRDCNSGCLPGAPDLMVTHPPPVFSEEPLVNFATDVLSPNPSEDKGLRTFKPGTDGCPPLDVPTAAEGPVIGSSPSRYRYQEVHKWVSPPIPNGSTVALNGSGSLNLWTRTVGGVSYGGRICVWLFQRQLNAYGAPEDTSALNLDAGNVPYFQYSANSWPSDKWSEVTIPLHFSLSRQLVAGSSLGLAVQVERSGTPNGGGLQFIYDEPSYESRLEVKTTSVLPF
jgi:Tfp pilus assembly protein PilV